MITIESDDLTAVTTAADHPARWSWPYSQVALVVWAAHGAGWDIGDPERVIAQWADADPRTVLAEVVPEMAQQPAGMLLTGAWSGLALYATVARNEAVRAAAATGTSLRQIGIGIGMTHQGVAKIVGR